MINAIKKIFGAGGPAVNYAELVKQGATIVDVRSRGEFANGQISGSVNIPLQSLEGNLSKIRKDKPVITCCASGARSASAKIVLKANGYAEVYNGGGWMSLKNKIK
jgi:phage shock protein E